MLMLVEGLPTTAAWLTLDNEAVVNQATALVRGELLTAATELDLWNRVCSAISDRDFTAPLRGSRGLRPMRMATRGSASLMMVCLPTPILGRTGALISGQRGCFAAIRGYV